MIVQNQLLDFAIGMLSLFLVASLLVTALQEALAQLLDLRARTLRAAIGNMLDGNAAGANTNAFFDHALIRSLNTRKAELGPSYIPRGVFVEVLRQIMTTQTAAKSFLDAARALPADDSRLHAILKGLADDATATAAQFEKAVGDWFDASMERVSGFYKRNAQLLAFFLGLMVAMTANLNAVAVGGFLADNAVARGVIAQTVSAHIQKQPQLDLLKQEDRHNLIAAMADIGARQALPIGWQSFPSNANATWLDIVRHYASQVVSNGLGQGALIGWLVTALATMLGAAFWFDLLKRFVNIRATGPSPKKPGET